MTDGVWQEGAFRSTQDFINLNRLYVTSGATFTTDDDLVLTGNSRTVLDNTISRMMTFTLITLKRCCVVLA